MSLNDHLELRESKVSRQVCLRSQVTVRIITSSNSTKLKLSMWTKVQTHLHLRYFQSTIVMCSTLLRKWYSPTTSTRLSLITWKAHLFWQVAQVYQWCKGFRMSEATVKTIIWEPMRLQILILIWMPKSSMICKAVEARLWCKEIWLLKKSDIWKTSTILSFMKNWWTKTTTTRIWSKNFL